MVGLDVAGAFDSAALPRLVEALLHYGVPHSVCRIVGTWLNGSSFRVNLRTPLGVVTSGEYVPTRGVPQGGVLSPLLWLLHVNKIIDGAMYSLHREVDLPPASWNVIVRIFADDISAASGHEDGQTTIWLSHVLIRCLLKQKGGTELDVMSPKYKNFLVE